MRWGSGLGDRVKDEGRGLVGFECRDAGRGGLDWGILLRAVDGRRGTGVGWPPTSDWSW